MAGNDQEAGLLAGTRHLAGIDVVLIIEDDHFQRRLRPFAACPYASFELLPVGLHPGARRLGRDGQVIEISKPFLGDGALGLDREGVALVPPE